MGQNAPIVNAFVFLGLWMGFAFILFQSVTVTVAWWGGELTRVGLREGFWIGLLPVWIFVYFRYFSIFRRNCDACRLPPDRP